MLFFVEVLVFSFIVYIDSKVCPSVDIRNDPSQFDKLKDCIVVNGSLYIVLMDSYKYEDFSDYSFPLLREVSDHIVLFRVEGLGSLDMLFPNLALIRGRKLFSEENYREALVILDMPNMTKVRFDKVKKID
ncbi:hypothetical protein HHI36_010446 [Cryptolaemus montrouzieri]|uniref:Receptor L-domain domain-containing protein n=1 Tax=Cryptolaemus montrouzieri TaxID=559131 RepID=A0ABD2MIL7_9CUCU